MEEIAQQFGEELQELLDRYKNHLSTPAIMRIAQPIFTKTIGFRYNPERFKKLKKFKEINGLKVPAELLEGPDPEFKKMLRGEFKYTEYKPGDEPNAFSGPNSICSQGPDGCCTTYKSGWGMCKGCTMYHGGK